MLQPFAEVRQVSVGGQSADQQFRRHRNFKPEYTKHTHKLFHQILSTTMQRSSHFEYPNEIKLAANDSVPNVANGTVIVFTFGMPATRWFLFPEFLLR